MKFTPITMPLIFPDWNQRGAIELDTTVGTHVTIKALTEFNCGVLIFKAEEAQRFADLFTSLAKKEIAGSVKVTGDGACFIQAQETNDGDPYREGVRITIGVEGNWNDEITIDLAYFKARELAKAIGEQAAAVGTENPDGLSLEDKAKCWDWFSRQHWNLDAVAAWGSQDFEFNEELETYILNGGD